MIRIPNRIRGHAGFFLAFFALVSAGGCGKESTGAQGGAPAPIVEVAEVTEKDVPVWSEWTASTDGMVNATIRPQIQGYLIARHYTEGDYVKKGQLLFEIDDRTFRADLKLAESRVAQARADWLNAKANLARIEPLAAHEAVSTKDLDEAIRNESASRAALDATTAAKEKALLDLQFTKIVSPVSGIAGIAQAQLGDLVGPGSTEELTTVSQVDPIKVIVPVTEQEYVSRMHAGNISGAELELILADGSIHPYKGKFAFADRQVDVGTGTIKMVALFPNPGNFLRPGQFARVRAKTSVLKATPLVPQRAVMQVQGKYEVAVVTSDNKVEMTPIKTGPRVGDLWAVKEGLTPGQKVVVEGVQKVHQGSIVITRPFLKDPSQGTMCQDKGN